MNQLISQQPMIIWTILASLFLFVSAGGIGFGQSYLNRKRREAKKEQQVKIEETTARATEAKAAASLERMDEDLTEIVSPAEPSLEQGEQGEGVAEVSPPADGPLIESVAAGSPSDDSVEVEEDSLLADIFSEEVFVDPKYQALVDRQQDIEIASLVQSAQDIFDTLYPGSN